VYLADSADAVSAADERREDHVDIVLNTEEQVLLVLLRHSGQVDRRSGQVAALLAAQQAAVLDRALEEVGTFLGHEKRDQSIVDVDVLADVNHLQSQNHA